jgi:hypothetical protein
MKLVDVTERTNGNNTKASLPAVVGLGAFQIVAGWWGHQPGQPAEVGVLHRPRP